MTPNLYPKVLVRTSTGDEVINENVITTLYPSVIVRTAPKTEIVTRPASTTLYPPVCVRLARIPTNTDIFSTVTFFPRVFTSSPPIIQSIEYLRDGKEGFTSQFENIFISSYVTNETPTNIVGNYSTDGINWFPNGSNTNIIETIKDFSSDCVFYPVFNQYEENFSIAWLENTPIGTLNLKYADLPMSKSIINIIPDNHIKVPQLIYIRPDVNDVDNNLITQNIPLSDILITDASNDEFTLDGFTPTAKYGFELRMPDNIKKITFTQNFRQSGKTEIRIGTAPQGGIAGKNAIASLPLGNFNVNIYYGKNTNTLFGSFQTDMNGIFQVHMNRGNYTFEIDVITDSIKFSQKLL